MEFTGERYVPELTADSEITIFHMQRYLSVLSLCKGKKVLDAACGEGYGSNMISDVAESVIGIDISKEAVENAKKKYDKSNLEYINASVEKLPLENESVDVVVSFETIEHVNKDIQNSFINEIKRVLKKDGILIMSSPDKKNYSDIPNFNNEYHVCEMYRDEFKEFLSTKFTNISLYYQGMFSDSYIFEEGNTRKGMLNLNFNINKEDSRAEYIIAVCSEVEIPEKLSGILWDDANFYYKQRDELSKIAKELENAKERLGEPGKIIEQKENYICEQRQIISDRDNEIRELNGIIEQKENYICEQRETMNKKEKEFADMMDKKNTDISELEARNDLLYNIARKSLIGRMLLKKYNITAEKKEN